MIMNQRILILLFGLAINCLASATSYSQDEKVTAQKMPLDVIINITPRLEAYLKARRAQVSELATKYERVLKTGLNKAADKGDLITTQAFQKEEARLDTLKKTLVLIPKDSVSAAQEQLTLPDLPDGTPEALVGLRKIWSTEWQKIRTKLDATLQQSLKVVESDLTKKRHFEDAKIVFDYRKLLLANSPGLLATSSTGTEPTNKPPDTPNAKTNGVLAAATKTAPYVNSLKMRFVPVKINGGPTDGKKILFSIWETRVQDYQEFVNDVRGRKWRKADFKQKDDHPAVQVSWLDAVAFCEWLTERESKKRKLGKHDYYRLPTDHEWSCAVGLGKEEDPQSAPNLKDGKDPDIYFWGRNFPPKRVVGNFYGEESKKDPKGNKMRIKGYNDGYEWTAPVGSFEANGFGLYDMGGNVWEWCHEWFDPLIKGPRVLRGTAWNNSREMSLRASNRGSGPTDAVTNTFGFRVVIESVTGDIAK